MNIGISNIEFYLGKLKVSFDKLAAARGFNASKMKEKLGLNYLSVSDPNETIIDLAKNAVTNLFENDADLSRTEIGRIVVATESSSDLAVPTAIYLHELLSLSSDTEAYDVKHACIAGVYALFDAINWISSGRNHGKKAIIVCSDIARYAKGSAAELTQGAGAVAILIEENPKLVDIDDITGTFSRRTNDFCRPISLNHAVVNGKQSVKCYCDALTEAFADYVSKSLSYKQKISRNNLQGRDVLNYSQIQSNSTTFDKFVFHTPYPQLPIQAIELINQDKNKIEESAHASMFTGNIYTGSLFLALASLLEFGNDPKNGKTVGFYAYGSGCSAKFFSGKILTNKQDWGISAALDLRKEIEIDEYDKLIYFDE